jgi:hypothetical protein
MKDEKSKIPYKTVVSILIALVAVSVASISWTAAQVNSQAGTLDGAATQAALDDASARISIATDLALNISFYDQYVLHLKTAALLEEQASTTPSLAAILEDERLREINRASFAQKWIEQDFVTRGQPLDTFRAQEYQQARVAEVASQKDMDWALSVSKADQVRDKALRLLSLNLFFTAAIFFFTIGLNTEDRSRLASAGVGVILFAAGLSFFFLWLD